MRARTPVLLAALLLTTPTLAVAPVTLDGPSVAPLGDGASRSPIVDGSLPPSALGTDGLAWLLEHWSPLSVDLREAVLADLPGPFGTSPGERLLQRATPRADRQESDAGGLPGAHEVDEPVTWTGEVVVDADLVFRGDLVIRDAVVRFTRSDLLVDVRSPGALTVEDSTLQWQGPRDDDAPALRAAAALEVRRSTFDGVGLAVLHDDDFRAPSLVADSTFRDGDVGVATERAQLEVTGSTFVNLSAGLEVVGDAGYVHLGPDVHGNTFEMNRAGMAVKSEAAGTYTGNLARANYFGVHCTSPGTEEEGGTHHKPTFRDNDLYTNYGEAIMGQRGITIESPTGDITIPDSECVHERPYLGPAGDARDSTFLSSKDSLSDTQAEPNAPEVPALPLPVTEVVTGATWTGEVVLDGPVVVNHPGSLTIEDAEVMGGHFVGAKVNGGLEVRRTTLHPGSQVFLRNDPDVIEASTLGGPAVRVPVTLHRCDCQLLDSEVAFLDGGVVASSGLLTDEGVYTQTIRGNTFQGSGQGVGIAAMVADPTVEGNTVVDAAAGFVDILATVSFRDNVIRSAAIGALTFAAQVTSEDNVFDRGSVGLLSILDVITSTSDVFAGFAIAVFPLLDVTVTFTLTNLTFNAYGMVPALSVVSLTSANLHHNYLFSLAAFTFETDLDTPTGITCTTCWPAEHEAWWGNVTLTRSLAANGVPDPPWAGAEVHARDGEVKDLRGTLAGPAIALPGGTLRVRDRSLTMDGFPIGAKGAGSGEDAPGAGTGTLEAVRAVFKDGGFVALNSSSSVLDTVRFQDFLPSALYLLWHGGTHTCLDVVDAPGAALWMMRRGDSDLVLRQLRVEGGNGVTSGLMASIPEPTHLRITDSAIVRPGGDGILKRNAVGTVSLERVNMLGSDVRGVTDKVKDIDSYAATSIDARGNWWDHVDGPGQSGADVLEDGDAPVLVEPWLGEAHSAPLCPWALLRTEDPRDDASVTFEDRSFDPSGLGVAQRTWDFGDGSAPLTTDEERVEHRFPDGGTYDVGVTVTSHSGAVAHATLEVEVAHTPPLPDFTFEAGDEVVPVAFTDASSHGNPNDLPPESWLYAWDFDGDGLADSDHRHPSYRFADGGLHTVTLTATDDDGMQAEVTHSVEVAHSAPEAAFEAVGEVETDTFVLRDTSTHPNAPTDGVAAWAWSCSDGFTSDDPEPSHRFADGGTYTCTLTVTDDDGEHDTVTRDVVVGHAAPVADFEVEAGDEVAGTTFTDTSSHPNSPTDDAPEGWTYAWDFDGDGQTDSDARHPAPVFDDGGARTVTLTVTDDDGLQATASQVVEVAHVAPQADFIWTPSDPDPDAPVDFHDTSTHPNAPHDAPPQGWSYAWDFDGDGATDATTPDATWTFPANGVYPVRLTVTDDDGLTDTLTLEVGVGNYPPVADFSFAPEAPTDLDDVQFTQEMSDPDGEVVDWTWDFGDGSATSDALDPVHRFADDGTYTVTLTVRDDRGGQTTVTKQVVVANVGPEASFTMDPMRPEADEPVQFTDTSTDADGSVVAWAWDFGDGNTSTAQHPSHTYPDGGTYTITLVVTDDDGAEATAVEEDVWVCEDGMRLPDLSYLTHHDLMSGSGHVEQCIDVGGGLP